MDWKQGWFGRRRPRWQDVVANVGALLVVTLCVHGMAVTFFPAGVLAGGQGMALCLAGGIVLHLAVLHAARSSGRLAALRALGRAQYRLYLASAPVVIGFVLWLLLANSLPWTFTRLLGQPHAETRSMLLAESSSDRLCRWQLRDSIPRASRRRLCVDRRFHQQYRERSPLQVRLLGRRSVFGSTVETIQALGAGGMASEQVSE